MGGVESPRSGEEIEHAITELETDQTVSEASLRVRLRETYNHLNTAWNSRDVSDEAVQHASHEDFDRWWMMPDDIIY
jgi:hypothetical protein